MLKDEIASPRPMNDMSLPFTTPLNSTMINDESAVAATSRKLYGKKPSQEPTQVIENRKEAEKQSTPLRRSNLNEKLNRLSAELRNEKLNDFVSKPSQSVKVKELPNVSSFSQSRDSGLISSPENLLGVSISWYILTVKVVP